ncbi:MAG: histidinol dehydrogenase, partial [Erythrobacter sp.]|nr:histidinol dehydrogenase [Erythrobacter sp.]
MRRLTISDPDFEAKFARLVNDRRESEAGVASDVRTIIDQVRLKGDDALVEYTARYDKHALTADLASWRIGAEECRAAYQMLLPDVRAALDMAADRIRTYHLGQLPENRDYRDAQNVRLGARWSAVEAAGLYVPGGRAAYPSSLL